MRVPSVGLTNDERRIVDEGYRLAERMLAHYHDKPTRVEVIRKWLARLRLFVLNRA